MLSGEALLKVGDGLGKYDDASDGTDGEYNRLGRATTFGCATLNPITGRRESVPEIRRGFPAGSLVKGPERVARFAHA
jgi:hypothetical protein